MSLLAVSCGSSGAAGEKDLTVWVDPFIGSGSLDSASLPSNTFPGATVPFGLVQLSPDTQEKIYATCSGYQWSDTTLYGFSHTHLSGAGITDLFDILLLPVTGPKETFMANMEGGDAKKTYSLFSHDRESASPGYYRVMLDSYGVTAELTATRNAGVHRYTYPKDKPSHVIVDLDHSFWKGRRWLAFETISAQMKVVDPYTVEGYRIVTGWARLRKVYFTMKFSQPITGYELYRGNKHYLKTDLIAGAEDRAPRGIFSFAPSNEPLEVQVAISAVSTENARQNLTAQTKDRSFDELRRTAERAWNKELNKIEVEGSDKHKKMFYSALYRNFIHPNNIADVNGDILLPDYTESSVGKGNAYYTNFSCWDTYRATHPLLLLTQQKKVADMINSMILQGEVYGYLPIWGLWGIDNYCMIGNHAVSIIAEAYKKGLQGVDWERAYDIVKKSLTRDHANTSFFSLVDRYGFYPHDKSHEVASIHLENAYNDWCASLMAEGLGKQEDAEFFRNRAMTYKNIYDPQTGFFRPRMSDSTWVEPFDPFSYYGDGKKRYYTEGNGWQYLFAAQHDIPGVMELMGGPEGMAKRLDELFTAENPNEVIEENASGFIGQYAHGNEPSHHDAYLYVYAGQPWKTQELVHRIVNEQYNDTHSGISGNDDLGQTSAWLIFSMMGFYPVTPASGAYVLGSPSLDKAVIHLENGKKFVMTAMNLSDKNIYVESVKYNGKPYGSWFITHDMVAGGGELEFVMTDRPVTTQYAEKPQNQ